ncbi:MULTISPECIES: hypothetical protein [Lysinibacillus]|uniref:hypothetical protein n=1 Tax=Lysinibacillus TaxID=400634 RepID=UPI0004DEECE6|nr:hypothetical protein [Lysinibacillus sphaericus]MBG9691493.1 hypothetical protein [Lysinibacillus sphaericus]QPA59062.1 hypothetical protein INQ55_01300 [Lysinibacillus sphaericus]
MLITNEKSNIEIFAKDWMEQLLKHTKNLKDYALIPDLLVQPEIINSELKYTISQFKKSDDKPILRVFTDNGQRYDLLEKIKSTTFLPEADLDSWIKETIGYDEYCLTINGITKWNNQLHTILTTEIVNKVVESVGVPLAGVDTYAFIAKGGYTPFGIHEDPDHSLIFHLGPDEKHVWIWRNAEYLKLTGGKNDRRFDFENLVPHAEHLVMKPGDCLFIPKGDFHVFENVGYSSFLGFILYPSNSLIIGNAGINMLVEINGNDSLYFVKEEELKDCIYQQMDRITQSPISVEEGIKQGSYYYHLLLRSNGYAIHKPILNKILKDEYYDKTLIRPLCFPILYEIYNGKITIFIRGRLLELKHLQGVVEAIEVVNTYQEVTYLKLLENLKNIVPLEVAEFLLDCIIQYKGLTVKENIYE